MSFPLRGPSTVLAQDACRERLLHTRRGFLACTSRALPTVVPASLSVREGRLLVTVRDPVLADQLVGQVVALGIGRRSLLFRRGWRVMARGQLGPRTAGADGALPLEPYQIEGVTEGRSPRSPADPVPGTDHHSTDHHSTDHHSTDHHAGEHHAAWQVKP